MADSVRIAPNNISPGGTKKKQGFINDDLDIKNIYTLVNKLRSWYKGTVAPSSPNVGDKWQDTSVTPNVLREWDGDSWEITDFFVPGADVVTVATANKLLKLDANAELPANAATASKFKTARTINGVSFDGSTDIILPVLFFDLQNYKALVTSNTIVTITADNNPFTNSGNISTTIDTSKVGAGGLDTGTLAANTWYYTHLIYGTAGISCLMSLSKTAPTLPTGYTKFVWTGSLRLDSSKYFMRTSQAGNETQYIVTASTNTANLPSMAKGVSGSTSTPTWTAVSKTTFIPPTALAIKVSFGGLLSANTQVILAPNTSYGAFNSSTNPPLLAASAPAEAGLVTNMVASFLIESDNIYYASTASGGFVSCMGWEDNL